MRVVERETDSRRLHKALHECGVFGKGMDVGLDAELGPVALGQRHHLAERVGRDAFGLGPRLAGIDYAGQDEDRPDPSRIGEGQDLRQVG